MCCIDRIIDFKPSSMPDLGISLDIVFYPGFDICVGTNQVCVVFYLPDIKMTIVKKLREGVAYNKGRNELYVWLTDDDLPSMKRSRVQVQVRIIDVFTDEMVCSTIQIINMDPIFRKRCTYSTSFNHIVPDEVERIIMKYWSEGDHCNQNDHDDAVDALKYAMFPNVYSLTEKNPYLECLFHDTHHQPFYDGNHTNREHDIIGKVTTIEQTKDGLEIHVEPISGYKPTKGLTFNKVKEEIEKSMNKKTIKDVDRIVITKNDLNEVLLRAYSGDEIVEKTIAKCSPDDIFDFNIGAKLAVDRLYDGYDMTPKSKRKPYNGKIFIRADKRIFTFYSNFWKTGSEYVRENKIWEVKDGKIVNMIGRALDTIYDDMTDEELSKLLTRSNSFYVGYYYNIVDGYFVR